MRIARYLSPALVLALLPTARLADPAATDPPGRVGRLSFISGSVSFRPGDVDDWGAATINYPLTGGDHLWTDTDARAEITVGSSAIRLSPQSAFGFLGLDDRTTQIRLSQGALNVRLRDLSEDEVFEIDTPNGSVSLLRPGTYRVDVDSTGDTTTVTVRHGQAEVTAAGSAFTVKADEAAVVSGSDSPMYDIHPALPPDEWEDWCVARDRRWDDARSAHYVSREMIGHEDLDEYGDWRETGPYGAVWVPRAVVVGWAPYRYGHWAWVDPWGWTWIDDAPWGFAPFHYGRWVYWDGAWAWVPGRVVARPVYAPALVVFVGGRNWSVAIGVGGGSGVAWFPLGPEEPYVPGYHVSNTYIRNVNVTNVNVTNINVTNVNVTNINYRNRNAPGAVTVVTQQTFVESRPVGRSVIVVPRERLDQARVVGGGARVAPSRQSVLGEEPASIPVRRPPDTVTRRTVVVRTPPPPPPVPFAARQQALRAHPGRPLDDSTLSSLRAQTPAARATPLVRPAIPATALPGGAPGGALRAAREGLPPARPLPASAAPPQRDDQRPAAHDAVRPAPARTPVGRPGRAERPAPAATPGAQSAPAAAPAERPRRAERPTAPTAPAARPGRAERPAPALTPPAVPAERPGRAERPAPAAAPAERPAPAAAPAERPAPAAAPAERPGRRERPAPSPAAAQPPSTPERPAPGERAAPPARPEPGRRPAVEKQPEKERKAERDTTKEKKPPN